MQCHMIKRIYSCRLKETNAGNKYIINHMSLYVYFVKFRFYLNYCLSLGYRSFHKRSRVCYSLVSLLKDYLLKYCLKETLDIFARFVGNCRLLSAVIAFIANSQHNCTARVLTYPPTFHHVLFVPR